MKSIPQSFIAVLLSSLIPATLSASVYKFKASVVDNDGEAEMYATWRVFANDSTTPIIGNVTGDDGVIYGTLEETGVYKLSIRSMSGSSLDIDFSVSDEIPEADLGTLTLAPGSLELNEITVTAQKPIVVKEIDRLAYDVKADPEATTAPLIDILRKVPMVTVDGDGNISVNGSSDFKIYKNGRPNNSFTKNAKDIFKAIPASSIKKIEVITDPGAREDAEGVGAVLNIVTDADTSLEGITGTLSMWLSSQNAIPMPRLWLSSQIGKVTFSVNGGYYNMNRTESEYTSRFKSAYESTGETLYFDDMSSTRRNAYYGGFEASYELDTLNLFTAEMNIYQNFGKSDNRRDYFMTAADGAINQSYIQTSYFPRLQYLDIDGNFNYQRSTRLKGETLTLSYQVSTTGQQQKQQTDYSDAVNMQVPYSGIISDFDLRFIEHTFQFDWARPIASKHTLDAGAKYISRRNHSKNFRDYIGSQQTFDDFNHNTDIAAGYADIRARFGKWGVRAGFRYEYSRLTAKFRSDNGHDFSSSINDYVPNATISYTINDANTLKLTFNRRISRPGINYLDPTVSETPRATTTGNPALHSANYNSLQLNYSLIKAKFNFDFTIQHRFSNNLISQILTTEGNRLYYTYGNVGKYRQWNLYAYGQWSPTDKTTLYATIYLDWRSMSMPDGTELSKPTYNPSLSLNQKLPWRMRLMANIGWWSGSVNDAYSYQRPSVAYLWNNFTLQRYFFDDDRLTIGVGAQNPFGPYKRTTTTVTSSPGYYAESTSTYAHNFAIFLSVNYRFGSLKASVKKTASSIENDDLQGRKN